jgi:secreted trypsin-like serine protease
MDVLVRWYWCCLILLLISLLSVASACGEDDPVLPTAEPGDESIGEERIVEGSPAPRGAFPATAMLVDSDAELLCGGSLVSPVWVLTAAHCVYGRNDELIDASDVEVVLGRLRLADSGGERIAVEEIVPHPDYSPITSDLALLRLSRPSIQPPIQIVDGRSDANLIQSGSVAHVAGWGSVSGSAYVPSARLLYTTLKIQSDLDCSASLQVRTPEYLGFFDPDVMVCAIGEGQKGSCNGDSGGPLMVREGAIPWLLAGVVSWGPIVGDKRCGNPGIPDVYADPVVMREFIEATLGAGGVEPPAAPSDLRAGSVSRGSVEILWQDNAPDETNMIIAAAVKGTDTWAYYNVRANSTKQRFRAEGPGPYIFAVQACNNSGCSSWTDVIEINAASQ